MPTVKRKADFLTSEEGAQVKQQLRAMVSDPAYHTESSYTANATLYPDHQMPFTDKHMSYLCDHPTTDVRHYMSNLRLSTRVK